MPLTAVFTACDLQPKIMSLPDSVGEFISARYPALLADPETMPEIYNSAATDYGVYASPQLYGTPTDDYVVYANVADYVPPASDSETLVTSSVDRPAPVDNTPGDDYLVVPMYGGGDDKSDNVDEIIIARGDTLYSVARRYNMSVDELARINGMSNADVLSVGQRLRVRAAADSNVVPNVAVDSRPVDNTPADKSVNATRVPLQDITVAPGDTLYSLSRKYSVPVNDLAVMNDLSAPFTLGAGQKLRVPNLASVSTPAVARTATPVTSGAEKAISKTSSSDKKSVPAENTKTAANANKPVETPDVAVAPKQPMTSSPSAAKTQKISSDPSKKLPAITARSSSKFSWPVRGKILSNYGAKSNGLFNDGINISAARGTPVNAAENGVVAYAGNEVKGMGNLVIIQHSDGWMTVYAHMDSMSVRRGARVNVGGKIGTVGATGKVDKPQLHFEIRKGTRAYNPSQYLKK